MDKQPRRRPLSPTKVIVSSFALAIAAGTILLMMPGATVPGGIKLIDAFFTATSALCVTGLVVVDTGSYFTGFGQGVILILIQIGGLGVMTFSSLLVLAVGRRLSLSSSRVLQEGLSLPERGGVLKLLRYIILFTLCAEVLGAGILYVQLTGSRTPGTALYYALFHSVSSFCNAGFSLFPDNLERFAGNWLINWTVAALIILGGIGFVTLVDLRQYLWPRQRHRNRLTLHSKLVLAVTFLLLLGGAAVIYLLEFGNTLYDLEPGTRYLSAFFHAVTCRTAGFNTLPIGSMTSATLLVMMFLMFIGGSPGGTAGGVKTTTAGILVLTVLSMIRGRRDVVLFGRQLPADVVQKALAIVTVSSVVVLIAIVTLLLTERALQDEVGNYFLRICFEVCSAFGTVGLSTGITPRLSAVGKAVIAVVMFIGRVGPLTMAFAALQHSKAAEIKYPEENIHVG